ncbi:hypothetical protein VP01_397g3 [Puccinia sorghi]|uniref:Uncharacterized protein n=1 Tax=Puccinia sorghi TaxID=27349 RepID=A0A0L6UT38_9BASI|nr:hypothetical protein VP01_397g3 [Puccinia sorghi]
MATGSDKDQSKICHEPPSMGDHSPSSHQFRAQLGSRRSDFARQSLTDAKRPAPAPAAFRRRPPPQTTSRSSPFNQLPSRFAESSHPPSRAKPASALPKTFQYKRAAGSSLPNRTSELRLRKPPCDKHESPGPIKSVYRSEKDHVKNHSISSAHSSLQAPPSQLDEVHTSSPAGYATGDAPGELIIVSSSAYSG